MSLEPGQIIDEKYRIVRVLGKGGMGAVYEGENTRIHRRVAIKVLLANVADQEDAVQRFEREAQAAGRIGSDHIVEVLDLGALPSGERYMVMEYLDGESLGDRIRRTGKMPAVTCAVVLEQLLEGLAAAHEAGIIHRDLKPDNVFLVKSKAGNSDFVKIVDFGVSKFSGGEDAFSMTRTGAVMGTPYYMSPEQARGQKIDHRSDLYSVGVVGYQMVTARVPFNAETFNELLFKIALESPEPVELHAPDLDPGLAQIISTAMARDATSRFASARHFAAALKQWRAGASFANPPSYGGAAYGQAIPAAPVSVRGSMPGQSAPGYALHGTAMHTPQGLHYGGAPAAPGSNPGAASYPGASRPGQSYPGGAPSQPGQSYPGMARTPSWTGQPHPYGQAPLPSAPGMTGPHAPIAVAPPSQPLSSVAVAAPQQLNPLMNQSSVGVAVAAAPPTKPKKGSALLAVVSVMAVLGVGGGVAVYKFMGHGPASAPGSAPSTTSAAVTVAPTGATADAPRTAAAPTESATAAAPSASAVAIEPTASASAAASAPVGVAQNPPPGVGKLPPHPSATSTPNTHPTGPRSITGDL